MAYDPQVVAAAREQLEKRRLAAQQKALAIREELCARIPRLKIIEQELTTAVPELTRVILNGGTDEEIERIRRHNLELQGEMATLLRQAGCERDNFEPIYTCAQCGDTGYVHGQVCDCYRRLLKEEACRRLSGLSAMRLTDFEEMDLSLYDDTVDPKSGKSSRKRMQEIVTYCRTYAQEFSPNADSLLLLGATGIGKTHLSLAIAKEVTQQGFGVIYGSVQPLFRHIESEYFGREDGDTQTQLIGCDLLVLDDLGMELDTPFYRTTLYDLLNTRLLERRPTIISTNLSATALRERYGDQISSRIIGGFVSLLCVGKDIRQLLRQRGMR